MAQKESMDILIKDMKIQDARIEADIQKYAGLLGNVEKHTKELKKRKEEKEIFEQLLYRIGGERDFFKDSVQIQKLENLAMAQEREIADNNNLIEAQQAYYDALREKDYQALWGQDEDKSAMAAICFAFERWKHASAGLVRTLLGTRNELSEDVARYLLEKVLVYSESKQEADEKTEEADILLRDVFDRTLHPQTDAVWQNIETCLNIRKTQRTRVRCKNVLNNYQGHKSRFETFEKDYANNYREILAEINKLEDQRIGKEVEAAVKSTKKWFLNRTAELEDLIRRRRNEAAIIEDHLQTLQSTYAELENGMELGLQPERCDAICNTLSSMESEADEVVDARKLDRERKQLLEDYQTHLKTIKAAKDAEVKRAEANQREKVKKKAERKRKFRKALLFLVAGAIVLFLFMRYCGNVYYGTKVYFGKWFFKNYRVAEGVETIPAGLFEGNQSMESITLPKSVTEIGESAFKGCTSLQEIVIPESVAEIGASAFAGCTSLQEIVIPESVTVIGSSVFAGCTSLQKIVIPESVTEIRASAFAGCTSLESVELHSSALSLGDSLFQDCGSLKEIKNEGNIADFEELLNGRVSNCCNLDMSEVYDNLYSRSIEGIPLLENEVQLKNLLDRRKIPYGEEFAEKFDPALDILTEAEFGEEKTDDYVRSVDFSFEMNHRGVMYTFEGTASSESESSEIKVELNCTDIDISELLQQLSAGDENAILEMVAGRAVPINGLDVTLKKDEIIVLESDLIGESEAKYSILLKLKINKPLCGITLLGRVQLLEQNGFVPELILLNGAADIDLLGSYTYSPEEGEESVLTIDKQYEKCYSVTVDGGKQLLVMDIVAAESKGKLISMGDGGDYNISSVILYADVDGISIGNRMYYKTGSDVSDIMPEDITPFTGVWQGHYYRDYGSMINNRRYILPIEENVLAVVSDFEELAAWSYWARGTTLDILNYDPQSGSCVIESKDWLEQPEGRGFVTLKGDVNDSYDMISGDSKSGGYLGGEWHLTITKTEPNNTAGLAADTDNWSIYDASGNVKEELLLRNIPEDAFIWNGSYYYLYNGFETWEEAEIYCESIGGHLAIITSAEENRTVYSYVRDRGFSDAFFGASDAAKEGQWRWVDGSEMSYANWHKNEPNNDKNEDYIMYYSNYSDGTWNDGAFKTGGIIICEWD